MDDTIYRQAAIDDIKAIYEYHDTVTEDRIIDHLKRLPSAQPERPEQPESAREYCAECGHIEMCRWYPYEGCEFRSVPSAQPERLKDDEQEQYCPHCGAKMEQEKKEAQQ